jgi:ParB-like chromosome segregation protein Spo0J
MSELASKLSNARLEIDRILLDPNNPRFADLSDDQRAVAETKYSEAGVQQRVLAKLLDGDFDIEELRKSIKQIGYVPVDQIVVRELADGFFVVVEGNRRIAAIKSLLQDPDDAMPEDRKNNLLALDVLVLTSSEKAEAQREQWIVQGLRHVSGMKAWGPYQQAKAVEALMSEGFNEKAAAQTMGMRVSTVAQLIRSLRALEAMRANAEFEEFATPRMFSYFQELQRLGSLKDWLGWSEADAAFANIERTNEFYTWITDQKDDEVKLTRFRGQFLIGHQAA